MGEQIPRKFSNADISRMFGVPRSIMAPSIKLAISLNTISWGSESVDRRDRSGSWDKFMYCTTGLYLGTKCLPFDYESLNGQTKLFHRESCADVRDIIMNMMNSST